MIPKYRHRYSAPLPSTAITSIEGSETTKQSFKDEVDVNNILRRYADTGHVPSAYFREGFFGDVSDIPDYQTAFQKIEEAKQLFMQLPVDIRRRFDHDPSKFLDFASDPANNSEMKKMGLTVPEETQPPIEQKLDILIQETKSLKTKKKPLPEEE